MRKSNWLVLLVCGISVWLYGLSGAHAQPVYGEDYITFKGTGKIIDNPTSAACQSVGINTGTRFSVIYRFTADPTVIADAVSFIAESQSLHRIVSTTGPNFSLNGASSTTTTTITRFSNFSSGTSSSNLTIASGINGPVSLATGNMKITNGQINDFFTVGCNITNFHAAAVVIPN